METKTVSVKIIFSGNTTRLKMSGEEAQKLKQNVKSNRDAWLDVETDRGGSCTLKASEILGLEIEPYVGASDKREGVTLREVCELAGFSYSTWVKKVNKKNKADAVMLDMVSDRKIRTTDENFNKLQLSERVRETLRKREQQRMSDAQ